MDIKKFSKPLTAFLALTIAFTSIAFPPKATKVFAAGRPHKHNEIDLLNDRGQYIYSACAEDSDSEVKFTTDFFKDGIKETFDPEKNINAEYTNKNGSRITIGKWSSLLEKSNENIMVQYNKDGDGLLSASWDTMQHNGYPGYDVVAYRLKYKSGSETYTVYVTCGTIYSTLTFGSTPGGTESAKWSDLNGRRDICQTCYDFISRNNIQKSLKAQGITIKPHTDNAEAQKESDETEYEYLAGLFTGAHPSNATVTATPIIDTFSGAQSRKTFGRVYDTITRISKKGDHAGYFYYKLPEPAVINGKRYIGIPMSSLFTIQSRWREYRRDFLEKAIIGNAKAQYYFNGNHKTDPASRNAYKSSMSSCVVHDKIIYFTAYDKPVKPVKPVKTHVKRVTNIINDNPDPEDQDLIDYPEPPQNPPDESEEVIETYHTWDDTSKDRSAIKPYYITYNDARNFDDEQGHHDAFTEEDEHGIVIPSGERLQNGNEDDAYWGQISFTSKSQVHDFQSTFKYEYNLYEAYQVPESYTYLDANNEPQTGTRMVTKYRFIGLQRRTVTGHVYRRAYNYRLNPDISNLYNFDNANTYNDAFTGKKNTFLKDEDHLINQEIKPDMNGPVMTKLSTVKKIPKFIYKNCKFEWMDTLPSEREKNLGFIRGSINGDGFTNDYTPASKALKKGTKIIEKHVGNGKDKPSYLRDGTPVTSFAKVTTGEFKIEYNGQTKTFLDSRERWVRFDGSPYNYKTIFKRGTSISEETKDKTQAEIDYENTKKAIDEQNEKIKKQNEKNKETREKNKEEREKAERKAKEGKVTFKIDNKTYTGTITRDDITKDNWKFSSDDLRYIKIGKHKQIKIDEINFIYKIAASETKNKKAKPIDFKKSGESTSTKIIEVSETGDNICFVCAEDGKGAIGKQKDKIYFYKNKSDKGIKVEKELTIMIETWELKENYKKKEVPDVSYNDNLENDNNSGNTKKHGSEQEGEDSGIEEDDDDDDENPFWEKMYKEAKKWLGTPYSMDPGKHLGTDYFDCSGFVYYVINNCGNGWHVGYKPSIRPGESASNDQRAYCSKIWGRHGTSGYREAVKKAQPGDLIFFTGPNHVGIYMGNGKMIDAQGNGVSEEPIDVSWWNYKFYCFGRLKCMEKSLNKLKEKKNLNSHLMSLRNMQSNLLSNLLANPENPDPDVLQNLKIKKVQENKLSTQIREIDNEIANGFFSFYNEDEEDSEDEDNGDEDDSSAIDTGITISADADPRDIPYIKDLYPVNRFLEGIEVNTYETSPAFSRELTKIPEDQANGKYPTTLDSTYVRAITTDGTSLAMGDQKYFGPAALIKQVYRMNEPVVVQTPVISPVVLYRDNGENNNPPDPRDSSSESEELYSSGSVKQVPTQLVEGKTNANLPQLRLDEVYWFKFSTRDHLQHMGYRDANTHSNAWENLGNTDSKYDKYVKAKYVHFPTDVILYQNEQPKYIKHVSDENAEGYWTPLERNDWEFVKFYIPVWAKEGIHDSGENQVLYKVEAYNVISNDGNDHSTDPSARERELNDHGNGDETPDNELYVATYEIPVQISGWIYDFQIVGTNEVGTYDKSYDETKQHNANWYAFCPNKEEKKAGPYNRLGGDDRYKALWPFIRQTVDGNIVNPWSLKDTIAIAAGSSHKYDNMGTFRKGSKFAYSVRTISNLWHDKDYLSIKPTFKFYDPETGRILDQNKGEIYIYYHDDSGDYTQLFIPYGSETDKNLIHYVKLSDGGFDGSYYTSDLDNTVSYPQAAYSPVSTTGDIESFTPRVTSGLAKEKRMFLNRRNKSFTLSNITLTSALRMFSGTDEQFKENVNRRAGSTASLQNLYNTGDDTDRLNNVVRNSMQTWYGEYFIPNRLFVSTMSPDELRKYAEEHEVTEQNGDKHTTTGLEENDPVAFKQKGFLILNFDIVSNKEENEGDDPTPDLVYKGPNGGSNMWKNENQKPSVDVPDPHDPTKNIPIPTEPGDVVVINIEESTNDDTQAEYFMIQ